MEEAMPRVVAGGKGSEAVAAAATKADPARDQRESLAARLLSLSFLHAGGCNAGCARSTSSTLSYGEGCSASTCWVQDQLVARCQPLPPRKQGRRDEAPAVLTLQHSLATVFELPIDLKPLQAVRHVFEHLKKDPTSTRHLLFAPKRLRFHVERPSWKSDIRWISARDELTFGWFAAQFEKLRIRKMLAFLGELVLFSGFIVARQVTSKSYFHTDFDNSGGKAFTLMTPVYDMTSLASCHLVCEDGSALKQYRYSLGRAIAFGDHFVHATQTGKASFPLAFLSFTFGLTSLTDSQWRNAEAYVKEQNPVYQNPQGRLVWSSAFF